MIDPAILVIVVLVAASISVIGERSKWVGSIIAVLATGFALLGVVLNIVNPFTGTSIFTQFGLYLTVNGFTSLIALVAALIGLLVIVYSISYIEERVGLYNIFTLGAIGFLIAMAYCWNLLWIFLLAEISTICSAPLIAHYWDATAFEGALKYLIIQIFASLFAVVGLGLLYQQAVGGGLVGVAAFNLDTLITSGAVTGIVGKIAIILLFIGFVVKIPSFPLHTWLPDASTVAPASISTLLHAMMIKVAGMPAFLVLFLFNYLFTNVLLWLIVCVLGTLTMLICVILAFAQTDLKRLLAFDSVSQMGYVILGLGIGGLSVNYFQLSGDATWLGVAAGGLAAGLFHLINHSLFKSLLFFSAGAVEHETGARDLNQLGGLLKSMPLTGSVMLIGSLSIAGVPLLNGFISKWMIFNVCIAAGWPVFAFIAIFTSAITFAVFLRVLCSVFLGSTPAIYADVKEPPNSMRIPPFMLAIGCIVFGVLPQLAIVNLLYPAAHFLLPTSTPPPVDPLISILSFFGGVWDPYWLFILILIGLSLGYVLYRIRRRDGPSVSKDKGMPFTGGVLYDPYLEVEAVKPPSTLFGYPFRSMLTGVRKSHTGFVNFYLLWIVAFALIMLMGLVVGWI